MKKTNKNRVKEFIRVDHAGERGAIKIYEGQLLALNTLVKDDDLKQCLYDVAPLMQWIPVDKDDTNRFDLLIAELQLHLISNSDLFTLLPI